MPCIHGQVVYCIVKVKAVTHSTTPATLVFADIFIFNFYTVTKLQMCDGPTS